ncbi:hypothetical protein FGADI_13326 [Fusarium gaditjirri]|uniref:Uncharacterized protein n=1 Tax=Fusarium gaditjirri TaxID=282569 RepID=A0A8H4SQ46_9HYPO|nr:hypothetical protein FGADI_13326 [Fusarium gaditjirri]
MTYNTNDMPMDNLQSPDSYNNTARRGVMLKIAEGRVTIRFAQALCLLAYYNFILGNIPMAGFDIATVQNMIQLLPGSELPKLFLRQASPIAFHTDRVSMHRKYSRSKPEILWEAAFQLQKPPSLARGRLWLTYGLSP